jgi:transposase
MSSRVVKRAYKYRVYPTPDQKQQLAATFGCVRYVYNRALAERSRAWTQEQRRISYAESDKMLTGWKRDPETSWLTEPSKGPLQATLRHLQGAFDKFWRKQTGYPKFKKKGKSKDSATYFSNCFTFRDGQLKLAKQGGLVRADGGGGRPVLSLEQDLLDMRAHRGLVAAARPGMDLPCGVSLDRDVNAAKNIRAAGLAVLACGDGVRPPRS